MLLANSGTQITLQILPEYNKHKNKIEFFGKNRMVFEEKTIKERYFELSPCAGKIAVLQNFSKHVAGLGSGGYTKAKDSKKTMQLYQDIVAKIK